MTTFFDNTEIIEIDGHVIDRAVFLANETEYDNTEKIIRYDQTTGVYREFEKGNQSGHDDGWPEGNDYINKLTTYLAAMNDGDEQPEHDPYAENIATAIALEDSLPAVDTLPILKKTYKHLTLKNRVNRKNFNIIGIDIVAMAGDGSTTELQEFHADCDLHGVPAFAEMQMWETVDLDKFIDLIENIPTGTTVIGPVGENNIYCYRMPKDDAATVQKQLANAVTLECERRLELGFDYDFGDVRGVHRIGTTKGDLVGWDEVTKASNALIALGQSSSTIDIVTDTGACSVTALEWQAIIAQSAAVRQPIWAGSFALLAMDPIPDNFADDSYWTAS